MRAKKKKQITAEDMFGVHVRIDDGEEWSIVRDGPGKPVEPARRSPRKGRRTGNDRKSKPT